MIMPEHIWREMVAFCEAGKTGRFEILVNEGHIAGANITQHFKVNQMGELVAIDKTTEHCIDSK